MDTLDGLRVTNKELNDRKARLEDIQKARAEAVKSTESSSQSAESAEQGGNTEEQAPDDVSSVAGNGAVETNSEDAALTGVRANEAQSAEAANTETSEDESVDVGDTTPTLSNVVRILYNYGKKVAAKLFSQKFFDVAKTPDFMKKLGLTGGKFTIRYGVIARHAGKDEQHNLPVDIWEQLPEALQHPFAITKYYVDAEKKKQKGYRIYTSLQLKDGSYVVVGVEVRNGGRDLEVNSIDTVFGKRKNSELIGNDDVIYRSEEITPEQSSLLNEPNPRQYPTEQELSTDKGNESSGKTSVSEKKSESGSADTSYFPTDQYGVTPDEELSTILLEIMEEVGATKENFVVDTSSGITDYNDGLLIDKDGIAVIRFEPDTAEMINGVRGVTYAAYFLAALVYTDEYRHRLFDYDKREELIDAFNKSVGREVASNGNSGMGYAFFFNIEDARRFKEFADKYLAKQNGQSKTDAQGNPLNEDGTLKVDVVKSIEELTDEDFTSPTRSVQLPAIPSVVDNAIGANGKPVIIKKNIFERNSENHPEVTPQHAREILVSALYRPDLYGQNQKARRPYNWIIINTKDSGGHNRLVVLEVNANKDNVEIVHWYSVEDRGVEKIKRQAQREGGHILILPSETEEAGALSGRQSGLSSESKDTETSGNGNQSSKKQAGEKQSKPKAQSKAKTDGEKIEDVGEKIAGAKKDLAREMTKQLQDATIESLVALPFSKVFKRLDLNKAVAEGVLRPKDARLAEAVLATSLSHPKPRVSSSRSSYERAKNARAIEAWARTAHAGIEILQQLFSMNEAHRDELIEKLSSQKGYNEEALSAKIADLRRWNPHLEGEDWGRCKPLNPIAVFLKVYEQLGYDTYGDVKCPVVDIDTSSMYDQYGLSDASGHTMYTTRQLLSEQDVVDELVYIMKVTNADADTDHPNSVFRAQGKEPLFEVIGYRFVYQKGRSSAKWSQSYKTAQEAEEARQQMRDKGYAVGTVQEEKKTNGYEQYMLTFRTPTGEYIELPQFTFDSKVELQEALNERHDEINDAVNAALSKENQKGESKSKDKAQVFSHWDSEKKETVYGVYLSDKYTEKSLFSNMPYTIKEGFATRKEAEAYLEEHKAEIEKIADDIDRSRREFVFFGGEADARVGEDYRKGKDVNAEDFQSAFGFRGVQFGNWANQKDRQAAINNAYDSFMDLAKLLDISPKALSLDGELGIAFGARGSGKASAHYESGEVVINLTKTRGVGALAHEWWHALDNYFARKGNVKSGFVTDNKGIQMREEMREAYNRLIDSIEKSDYDARSRQRGKSYWGSKVEETARMFEVWVSSELEKRGERNYFLVGDGTDMEERWAQMNYEIYLPAQLLGGNKTDEKPMSFEEFKKTPRALAGFVYPTRAELETFGKDLRNIFDTVQERVDGTTGNVALFQMDSAERDNTSAENRLAFDAVTELLDNAGVQTELMTNEEMEQLAQGDASLSRSKSPRAKWLDAYVYVVSRLYGKDKKTVRDEILKKIAEARKEAKDLYERVLSGNFDELTLRKLNEYIDDATNRNRHYRPLSQRLPERALLSLSKDDRTAAVDALFSRICESTVPANGRTRAEGRRKIEARKEELLEAWANATGNWHESIADFTKEAEPIRSGTDSDVYLSDDGTKVIKASKGKFNNRKHPSDIDQVPLFNSVFPGSAYRILGYGRLNGKFVRFLEQPFVDFSTTTPVTTEERVEYMRSLGFEPQNEERTLFSNGEIVVSDLHKSNIVKGEDGNVWVIDADVKLHTKDLGGNYTYAPVETDTDTAELMTVYHGSGAKFDRIEFLRNGTTVYGAAVGGKILLNAEHLNPNTPVHEYTHLWDKAVQQKNPELWRRGVELMKQTSLWKEVENDPNYAGLDENGIASEVHSRLTGDKGAAELERMSREVLDGNGGIIDKASKMSVIQKLRKWLSDFWYWVKDTMTSWSKDEADKVSIEDFVNMPLADLEKRGVPFVETNNTGKPVTRFREDEIAAMETPILESKGAFKSLAEAEQWAKKNLQGKSYTNNFTNDEVYISGKSVSEMLNPKSAKKINVRTHLAALQSVPEFIKTGIPAEIHTDTHGRGYDVMRLYNAIIINDELYRVKSTVKRVPQGDIYYTYEIQKMELIEGSDNTVGSLRGTYLIPKSSSVNSISGAKLLKGVKKTNSDELILPEDEDIRFRTVFGGNSGYVGYSMSKRAAQAREEGRYPKTDFKKVYDIPSNTFDILVSAGVIDDSEWHHTSSWGNRTTFYKWDEWEDYEGADYERRNRNRDVYEQNRKEINNMVKAFQKELKEKYPEDGENPYNNNPLSEEATAAVNAENDRYYNELDNGVVNYDNWDDDQFRRAKAEHNERLKEIYDNLSPEDKAIQEETAKYYEWLKASVDKSDNREKARSEFAEKIKDYFNKKAEELSSEERDRRNEGSPVTNHLLSRDGMREAVVELSESLGVEVEFVRDSELPEGHRGAMGMWRNGKVYVCLEFLRRSTFAKENRTELFNGKCHHKCFKGSLSCETYQ